MSDRILEQRINIKFCVELGKNANDTRKMLSKAYWGEAMKKPTVFVWRKRFKEGREHVEGGERNGRSKSYRTDENVQKFGILCILLDF
jgi:hypothetical protein